MGGSGKVKPTVWFAARELFTPKNGGVLRFYHVKDGFTAKHTQRRSFRPENLNHSGKVVTHHGDRGAPYFSTFVLASETCWPYDGHSARGISESDNQPLHIRTLMGLGNLPETDGLALVFGVLDVRRMVGVILRKGRERAEHDDRQEKLLHFDVISVESSRVLDLVGLIRSATKNSNQNKSENYRNEIGCRRSIDRERLAEWSQKTLSEQSTDGIESCKESEDTRNEHPLNRVVGCTLFKKTYVFLPSVLIIAHD